MPKYSYIITLQNGEPIYNSKDYNLFFSSEDSAEDDALLTIEDIVESQDCPEDERFLSGDFRYKIIQH